MYISVGIPNGKGTCDWHLIPSYIFYRKNGEIFYKDEYEFYGLNRNELHFSQLHYEDKFRIEDYLKESSELFD
jgi:hypothetical protein